MGFFDGVLQSALFEIKRIINRPYLLSMISVIPLFVMGLLVAILFGGIVEDLPISVVDKDNSGFSRNLSSKLDATQTLRVARHDTDLKSAARALRNNEIYAIVVIPEHMSKDIQLGAQPKITSMVNAQYILLGKVISATLMKVFLTNVGESSMVHQLIEAENFDLALSSVEPIKMQITPFFNTYNNYFYFLVSALLPAVWQVFVVVAMLISVGSLYKAGEDEAWIENANGSVTAALLGMVLPYTFAFMILGAGFLGFIYGILGWSFAGNWLFVIVALLLTTLAYQAIALALFSIFFEYSASLSLAAVYTSPAFAFLGITFPLESMDFIPQFVNMLLPIGHYMQIQISQANHGAALIDIVPQFLYLVSFLVLVPVILWRFDSQRRSA